MSGRLSAAGRLALSVRSAFAALADPQRADMVATLAETTSGGTLEMLHRRMQSHPVLSSCPHCHHSDPGVPDRRSYSGGAPSSHRGLN